MGQPLYQQITDDLRGKIDAGELPAGSRLPTEPELVARYGASRNTVRVALNRLAALGLVTTRPGQGTFVVLRPEPFVTTLTGDPGSGDGGDEGASYLSQVNLQHREPKETVPTVGVQPAPEAISRRLRIPPHSQVVSRHRQRFIDNVPWSLRTSYYPFDFITRGAVQLLLAKGITPGAMRYLEEKLGLRQTGYRDWITVRTPDDAEQAFFGLPRDTSVFEVFRTAFDQHKTPMRVTVTVFPADRNQFIVNVGEGVPAPQYSDVGPAPSATGQ